MSAKLPLPSVLLLCLLLSACGGGSPGSGGTSGTTSGGTTGGSTSGGSTGGTSTGSTTGGSTTGATSGGSTTGGSTGGGSTGGTTGGSTGGSTGGTTGGTTGGSIGTGPAARLSARLGRANRLLIGLGEGNDLSRINSQALRPDIYDRYLTGIGTGQWPEYVPGAPRGEYVNQVAAAADSIGAIPMFTLYQMAALGDGNLSILDNRNVMTQYWSQTVLLFQRLATYNRPALVSFEPDFWGYVQQQTAGGDPTARFAWVNITPECATLPNDVTGVGRCLVRIARQYAPRVAVGFPPSTFGDPVQANVEAFMNRIGAATADFVTMQTLDRDAGCFEAVPQPSYCQRVRIPYYWDESNQTSPNFREHFAAAQSFGRAIGNLPLVWWQTPMGQPAASSLGGRSKRWRDNRVNYFLTHGSELVAAGGMAVVFSTGEPNQTDISSDDGQFQRLSNAYLLAPAALP